jgi:hypothetical protein
MIVLKFTTEYADVFIGTLTQVVGEREKRICQVALSKNVKFTYRGVPERFAGEYKISYKYAGTHHVPQVVPVLHVATPEGAMERYVPQSGWWSGVPSHH